MKEFCKYTEKWLNHDQQIIECKTNHDHCKMLCAFFIAYNRELF